MYFDAGTSNLWLGLVDISMGQQTKRWPWRQEEGQEGIRHQNLLPFTESKVGMSFGKFVHSRCLGDICKKCLSER